MTLDDLFRRAVEGHRDAIALIDAQLHGAAKRLI
jgi:hypothetical protein